MNRRSLLFVCFFCCANHGSAAEDHWPQFRGPQSRGVATNAGLPHVWDTQTNVAWAVDVPGRSWSSPVVWGQKAFLLSAVSAGKNHDPKKGLYFGGNRKDPLQDEHRYVVYCFDLESGQTLWHKVAHAAKPETPIHIKNTYASETPVTDGKRIYAYFGNVGVFAYDLDGNLVWSHRLDPMPLRYGWGTAASPVIHDDQLILVNDNEEASYLLALDAGSGDIKWKTPRNEKSNWSTPYVWQHEGGVEIVTAGSGRVRSYDLAGQLLWELKGMSSITIATPYSAHGFLFVSSGYVLDDNRPLYAIRHGGQGDISLRSGETANRSIAWSQPKAAPYNPSSIVYGDYLYTLLDRGFLACYEAKTGKLVYGKKRLGSGSGYTASPWAYDGKIFCLNEDGDTLVVRAGPEFELVRTNPLEEMCMATPAIAGDRLLIRTLTKFYCLRQARKSTPSK